MDPELLSPPRRTPPPTERWDSCSVFAVHSDNRIRCFHSQTLLRRYHILSPLSSHFNIAVVTGGTEFGGILAASSGSWNSPGCCLFSVRDRSVLARSTRQCSESDALGVINRGHLTSFMSNILVATGSSDVCIERVNDDDGSYALTRVCTLSPTSPEISRVVRIHHIPSWSDSSVVFGGYSAISEETCIHWYDVTKQTQMETFRGHISAIQGLDSDSEKGLLFSTARDRSMRIWSQHSPKPIATIDLPSKHNWSERENCVLVVPNHNFVVVGLSEGRICSYDVRYLGGGDLGTAKGRRRQQQKSERSMMSKQFGWGVFRALAQISDDRIVGLNRSICVMQIKRDGFRIKGLRKKRAAVSPARDVCVLRPEDEERQTSRDGRVLLQERIRFLVELKHIAQRVRLVLFGVDSEAGFCCWRGCLLELIS